MRVLYFAGARELAGRGEETLELPDHVRTVGELAAWTYARIPALGARASSLRWARNDAFAEMSDPLAEGDELALIPPVAGG